MHRLIYDWNGAGRPAASSAVMLNDETLRDGLQSPSVRRPSIDEKVRILHLIDALGIDSADIGLPGAGAQVAADVEHLAREIAASGLSVRPNCAARTLVADITPVVEIAQRVGRPIECCTFIGSSPIRQYAEDWTIERLERLTAEAVGFAVSHGLPVMYVTEDTTRADPDSLRRLYSTAIRAGAARVCISDTTGHATPDGAAAVTRFIASVIEECGGGIGIDWHGHRDANLRRLPEYCAEVSSACGVPIPANYPVVGRDAFRTATGVHAAAVIKAFRKGEPDLMDAVYSSVPASLVGREQEIEIGPMSGRSNVVYWLEKRGLTADAERVDRILATAKKAAGVLTDEEILGAAG